MSHDRKGRATVYHLRWTRWAAYRFVTEGPQMGWVFPSGSSCEEYDPTQERHLPEALARVWRRFNTVYSLYRSAREHYPLKMLWRPIEEFLHHFGFLGQLQLTSPHDETGQVWKKGQIDGEIFISPAAEQWLWIIQHAENVDRCLSLAGTIRHGSLTQLVDCISRLEKWSTQIEQISPHRFRYVPGSRPRILYIPTLSETQRPVQTSTLYEPGMAPSDKATSIIAACLKDNLDLRGMTREYDRARRGSVLRCAALIQLVYQQLADGIYGEQLRECQECHGWFFAHHGQQVFCPPPPGGTDSRCGRRARERMRRRDAQSLYGNGQLRKTRQGSG